MAPTTAIYDYTPTQALVIGLYDEYRTSLMNAKYYGQRLAWIQTWSLLADVVVAVAASAAFAGFAVWKAEPGATFFSVVLGVAAVVSAVRPILRPSERIDRYSKLHYGYLEVYYRIQALISDMRGVGRVTNEHKTKASEIAERFRALELESDAYQRAAKLLKIQDEVDRAIPSSQLWLPQE